MASVLDITSGSGRLNHSEAAAPPAAPLKLSCLRREWLQVSSFLPIQDALNLLSAGLICRYLDEDERRLNFINAVKLGYGAYLESYPINGAYHLESYPIKRISNIADVALNDRKRISGIVDMALNDRERISNIADMALDYRERLFAFIKEYRELSEDSCPYTKENEDEILRILKDPITSASINTPAINQLVVLASKYGLLNIVRKVIDIPELSHPLRCGAIAAAIRQDAIDFMRTIISKGKIKRNDLASILIEAIPAHGGVVEDVCARIPWAEGNLSRIAIGAIEKKAAKFAWKMFDSGLMEAFPKDRLIFLADVLLKQPINRVMEFMQHPVLPLLKSQAPDHYYHFISGVILRVLEAIEKETSGARKGMLIDFARDMMQMNEIGVGGQLKIFVEIIHLASLETKADLRAGILGCAKAIVNSEVMDEEAGRKTALIAAIGGIKKVENADIQNDILNLAKSILRSRANSGGVLSVPLRAVLEVAQEAKTAETQVRALDFAWELLSSLSPDNPDQLTHSLRLAIRVAESAQNIEIQTDAIVLARALFERAETDEISRNNALSAMLSAVAKAKNSKIQAHMMDFARDIYELGVFRVGAMCGSDGGSVFILAIRAAVSAHHVEIKKDAEALAWGILKREDVIIGESSIVEAIGIADEKDKALAMEIFRESRARFNDVAESVFS
ncbi:MAG: hypothetical protein K9M07_01305 [Simkaniaceae bacterium]|nr:hypothetical protein [Simkaniaceae bacterium]